MTHDEIIAVVQAHKAGKGIEMRPRGAQNGRWKPAYIPSWDFSHYNYRVRSDQEQEADVIVHYAVIAWKNSEQRPTDNLRLVFDRKTGKLKVAEVLK